MWMRRGVAAKLELEMIGNDIIILRECSRYNRTYYSTWESLESDPDYERFFGPPKRVDSPSGAVAIIFVMLQVVLMVDIALDRTPWSTVNASACMAIGVLSMVGWILCPRGGNTWKRHPFLIQSDDHSKVFGVLDIYQDRRSRTCSITVGILPEHRGKKIGSIATRAAIRYSFEKLDALRVESTALSSNPASINMNDRMIHEGTLKERYLIEGEPVDEHMYRLLKAEWLAQSRTQMDAD